MAHTADVSVEKFVDLLNEDLGTEYQSIVQYTNHIATITGAEYLSILDELKVHVGQELSHAQILAEQVSFLGGEPIVTVPPVQRAADSRAALRPTSASRATSSSATASASPRPTRCELADVAEALRPLLEQTQEHVRDLTTALGD